MKIRCVKSGFVETPDNPLISKLIIQYDNDTESHCTVVFKNKKICKMRIRCSVYNSQYGLQVSRDGTLLFSGTWEDGIYAYDIETGTLLWRFPKGKARTMIVSGDDLVVARAYSSVFKLNIYSGEKRETEITTRTLENIYHLSKDLFFLNSYRGRCCIIHYKDFAIEHTFAKAETNPQKCLSFFINNVELSKDNHVVIKGYEDFPNFRYNANSLIGKKFSRELFSYEIRNDDFSS
ncbi:MAG: hypothetical protein IKX86_04545 [Clostridia bacterium]|nr:hypothetical protein [Clostridia bacterium]MBR5767921.1 hypothetical protein [Clostridia bacterium]